MAGADAHPLLLTALLHARELVSPSRSSAAAAEEFQLTTKDPILLAQLCCLIGEKTRAFQLLDEAADMKHYRIAAVNMFPQFGAIREDSRYQRLVKRIGLNS
jgi:hypothetical protein